jgi:ubiquitin-conjugating enzyme E2 G1
MANFSCELLKRQLIELTKTPPEGVSVGIKDDNLFHREVLMVGPPDTML